MANCRLIFVRHGQSEGNLNHAFLGHTDLPLTELGHSQAQLTAEYLKNTDIDVIYASDLSRAWQTAEHIASVKDLSIIADPLLREIFAGKWENELFENIYKLYGEEFRIWLNDIGNSKCTGGESFRDLYKRITTEVTRIAEASNGLTVCLATHATPIRCMRLLAKGLNFDDAQDLGWTSNASLTVIDYNDGKFEIVTDHQYEHLGELSTTLPKTV